MNYCWVFHSSINNLYYYNKTTSFQPLFIEYCIRLPLRTSSSPLFLTRLCELCPTSPGCDSPTQSRSLLFGWPWLWNSGVPWASPMHAHSEMQGNQWEVGAGGWSLSSSPRGLFWDVGSALSRGWSHEIQQTFTLRIPFSHFCSPGISFPSKVVEFKAFVPGSVFWGRQLRRALFMC